MKNLIISFFLIITFLLNCSQPKYEKEIIAYFPQWGVKHQPFLVKHLERNNAIDKITVLNYAFAYPGPDSTGKITVEFMNDYFDYIQSYSSEMSIDGIADSANQKLRGHFNQLRKLKKRHPHIKIVISLGGWEGSIYFSDAALTEKSRKIFVESCINTFIKGDLPIKNGAGGKGVAANIFDGIDIDWEFPVKGGLPTMHHNPKDNDNLTKLYAYFRKKLDEINPNLLLTAAVPAKNDPARIYNINEDAQYLNWYMLMTYDFYGGWDTKTGHLTNLLSSTKSESDFSMDKAVKIFRDKYQVPTHKIIPGAAFYGRSWKNVSNSNNGFNQTGNNGPGTYEPGYDYYVDIVDKHSVNYTTFWDTLSMAETRYSPENKIYWSYDDPQSVTLKSRYVDAYNLRGIMFWEISGDDTTNTLLKCIYNKNMPDVKIENSQENNIPPKIKIKQFNNDQNLISDSNLILNVDASDSDGKIIKVEFFIDKKSIGFDTKPPFNWVWFNSQKGNHTISAAAQDNSGAITHSLPYNVRIK